MLGSMSIGSRERAWGPLGDMSGSVPEACGKAGWHPLAPGAHRRSSCAHFRVSLANEGQRKPWLSNILPANARQ